jgi:proteasome lid subunit RPN8/RPN11
MRNASIEAAVRDHARRAAPAEACGLVVRTGGGELTAVPGRNVSEGPEEAFTLDPAAWIEAEELGEVVALYHSHPATPAVPSSWDRGSCDRSGLPWLIYSLPEEAFVTVRPSGALLPLEERPFAFGLHDCGTLVADYFLGELGVPLSVEPYLDMDFFQDPGHKPYRRKFLDNGFMEIPRAQFGEDFCGLRIHDCLLMQVQAGAPNHAAVYVGGNLILHHLQGRLSCRDVFGLYFRRATVHVMRHPAACGRPSQGGIK